MISASRRTRVRTIALRSSIDNLLARLSTDRMRIQRMSPVTGESLPQL
jgi:hypothetical protein